MEGPCLKNEVELARWLREIAPVSKSDDLSLLPETHMVEGENRPLEVVL